MFVCVYMCVYAFATVILQQLIIDDLIKNHLSFFMYITIQNITNKNRARDIN